MPPLFRRREPDLKPVSDKGTDGRPRWKPLVVATLRATEIALDGLPIPAARACIAVVLKVIEASDVASNNETSLKQLHTRCSELIDFMHLVTSNIPRELQEVVNRLDHKLAELAEQWESCLTKKPRKRDIFLRLLTASSDRDKLEGFVSELNAAIQDFLACFEVKSWTIAYREIVKNRHFAALSSMNRAEYASYNALRSDRATPCLEGTRRTVLANIMAWAANEDVDHPPIFWLNGLAGIGKTTIAYTVASQLDNQKRLGGSFFFLRTDDQLKDARLVFPTLAWQLSGLYPSAKTRLAETLEKDPSCVNQSLAKQFKSLIFDPMSTVTLSNPLILVLDALDECQPRNFTADLMRILLNNIKQIPFLRVLVTSRPEAYIREALGLTSFMSVHRKLVLHENAEVQQEVEADIRLFLKTSLQEIWDRTRLSSAEWPSAEDLEILVQQSGKLFIYAATAVRFVGGSQSLNVERQLRCLLELQTRHVPNSEVEPYKHLDQLYLTILGTAFQAIDMTDAYYSTRFQKIVGSIVLMQRTLPMECLATFLGDFNVDEIRNTLYDLHAIFIVPDDPSQAIQTYHRLFLISSQVLSAAPTAPHTLTRRIRSYTSSFDASPQWNKLLAPQTDAPRVDTRAPPRAYSSRVSWSKINNILILT